MKPTGSLITVDGRSALRFERQLNSPIERVWRAVTAPEELARWFVVPIEWTPSAGETFESFGAVGTVTELDEPRLVAWEWNGDLFRFELTPNSGGCLLVFTHVFDDRSRAAEQAAGWDGYLEQLEMHLEHGEVREGEAFTALSERHDAYAETFGLDPPPRLSD